MVPPRPKAGEQNLRCAENGRKPAWIKAQTDASKIFLPEKREFNDIGTVNAAFPLLAGNTQRTDTAEAQRSPGRGVSTGTIPERLRLWAQTRPQEVFCTFLSSGRAEPITFGDLYQRSCAYARYFSEQGVKRGDLALVILQHTPHLFYGYLGAILAGAVPSFMPFPSKKQRADLYWADHEALFARIRPRIVLTYELNLAAAQAALPSYAVPTVIASDAILTGATNGDVRYPGFASLPDDVACLQHSSGTTSLKKGVMLTHRAVMEEVAAYSRALAFGQGDSIASWLPLYHDMGFIACFMTSLIEGTHLVALDPFEWTMRPHLLLDAIQHYRATFCWLPNFAFSHIVNASPPQAHWDLSSIRAIINCSEPCKARTFERFLDRFGGCGVDATKLQVCYAMAENVFAVTQTTLGRAARVVDVDASAFLAGRVGPAAPGEACRAVMSCGRPIDGVGIRICDASSNAVPSNRIGEVHVASPFLFTGYYKLPERTLERLQGGWYKTGDMGFTLDGELFVTGRIDDMIIVNGRNYYAHEIESIVNSVPGLLPGRNVAIGIEDARADATVVVVLAECAPATDPDSIAREVRREILETLGLAIHALVPLRAGDLVKTTSGKISRSENKRLYTEGMIVEA